MKWYYWMVMICLVWYILYYYRSPSSVAILQTTLPEFSFDILLQRQPVFIFEKVNDITHLQHAWFPSNKVDVFQQSARDTDDWRKNKYKYLLLQPTSDTEVVLYPANKKLTTDSVPPEEETLLAIKCRAHQIVLLPYRWHFFIPKEVSYIWMGVHDWITRFLP
jgi:hypothetical protein